MDSFSGVILLGINYNLMVIMMMMMKTIMVIIIMTMMIFDNKGLQTDARHERQMNKHTCNCSLPMA